MYDLEAVMRRTVKNVYGVKTDKRSALGHKKTTPKDELRGLGKTSCYFCGKKGSATLLTRELCAWHEGLIRELLRAGKVKHLADLLRVPVEKVEKAVDHRLKPAGADHLEHADERDDS